MHKTTKYFSLIELLVVISVISILLTILLPALKRTKDKVMQLHCGNNQKSIYAALHLYADEWNGILPREWLASSDIPNGYGASNEIDWLHRIIYSTDALGKKTINTFSGHYRTEASTCPVAGVKVTYKAYPGGYGINNYGPLFDGIDWDNYSWRLFARPSEKILVMDAGGIGVNKFDPQNADFVFADYRHLLKANAVHVDGHVGHYFLNNWANYDRLIHFKTKY